MRRYHDALGGYGVTGAYPFEECWDDYRRFGWNGLIMSVIAAMMVRRDARTDAMFATLANRHATQTQDLTAIDCLRCACAPVRLCGCALERLDGPQ